jgi:predicted aldo/keto reductase-like oxidoreductase
MGAAFKGRRDAALLVAHLGAVEQDGQYARSRDLKLSEAYFHDFLRRYQTDYVDVLMIHNCDEQEDLDGVLGLNGMLDLAQKMQAQGKARYIGFSGHTPATAQQAAESEYIDVIMFPVNLAGHAIPGREAFLSACAILDIGVVAMKPYAGGRLLEARAAARSARSLPAAT